MTRFKGIIVVREGVLIEAKDINDFKKKVKDFWIELHDIELSDSEIRHIKEVKE